MDWAKTRKMLRGLFRDSLLLCSGDCDGDGQYGSE